MLGDNTTVVVAANGALIPAGMRRLLAYVIKNRFVDVMVCSGAMLFQDLHETLGRQHFQAHPSMTEAELDASQISRTATDCTRPADRPRRIFFQSSGLIW